VSGYFDYNASAPMRPESIEAGLRAARDLVGNASSMHAAGRRVRAALDDSRQEIAGLLGVAPAELCFTSGATESNNTVLSGAVAANPSLQLAVSATEHASVLAPARALGERGSELRVLAVNSAGQIEQEEWASLKDGPDTLCSVAAVNGESGVITDWSVLDGGLDSGLDERHLLHVDAAQAFGRIAECAPPRADFVSMSAHKLGGPVGVGALVVRKRALKRIAPQMLGGPQESSLRAGTENVPGIVAFAAAARVAVADAARDAQRLRSFRESIDAAILRVAPSRLRISSTEGLANTLTVALPNISSEIVIAGLDLEGFQVSTGSACAAASPEPSHVLAAMKVDPSMLHNVLRISMGWGTTEDSIDAFITALQRVWTRADLARVEHQQAAAGSRA
jgi:cysteine desulfurase